MYGIALREWGKLVARLPKVTPIIKGVIDDILPASLKANKWEIQKSTHDVIDVIAREVKPKGTMLRSLGKNAVWVGVAAWVAKIGDSLMNKAGSEVSPDTTLDTQAKDLAKDERVKIQYVNFGDKMLNRTTPIDEVKQFMEQALVNYHRDYPSDKIPVNQDWLVISMINPNQLWLFFTETNNPTKEYYKWHCLREIYKAQIRLKQEWENYHIFPEYTQLWSKISHDLNKDAEVSKYSAKFISENNQKISELSLPENIRSVLLGKTPPTIWQIRKIQEELDMSTDWKFWKITFNALEKKYPHA
jgi:hypothetical protein